ncbi:AGR303Wp [Eremothecium gossypii ATCC 10895]|uniref:5'-3' exoribonuclease 2 n=1 Tax=Eremothecium gossypii (strain ATCC 10895 / CBS 109.51 / FGSC 9923 / NRRL Y-1056) TaxID=284811 RepID=XRN2_EREGS|nr:AGR303Wp [Eremothecium gossypii ATCC 10895]Q74ZA0.4 RecName: Full=5'-3' exoribonuclease 2 [Eremothecium gossypii ATCC 10895]AAS54793.2 AGR303Wp [Eremothecium gossypii ATCC 10895]AEY99125.1 FAGR303Wp [Eremothecium gossypii FDAG1]
MGVPSFFRWLSRKYPKIISPVIEDTPQVVDGVKLPIDYSAANPNGELDNLYLDMNGIVHPCSHPENKPAPETEDEMLLAVFEYTNRVLNMARPRKVLMIAVDGVAPRAKMNQQRSRRFRSARDAKLANEEKARVLAEREAYGEMIDDAVKAKKSWDTNAITPGTPFMDKLAAALRYWTSFKLATDPGWKNLQVIISDATVPGEGEHKIMNFIRSQRADVQYNPNTTHCIYGLDADLIFLGLATHEPHFKILREDVFAQDNRRRPRQHDMMDMSAEEKQALIEQDAEKPFLWLHVSVLREYLSAELLVPRLPFHFDLERAIDDWVFMCFFCGNDFLPHLPSLDVRENSIDILVDIWKAVLPSLKTYLTCDGKLNLKGVEKVLAQLGNRESDIFKKKYEQELRKKEAQERRKMLKNNPNVTKGKVDRNFTVPLESMPVFDVNGNAAAGSLNLTNKDFANMRKEITLANEGNTKALDALKRRSDENRTQRTSDTRDFSQEELESAIEVSKGDNLSAAASLRERILAKRKAAEDPEGAPEPKNPHKAPSASETEAATPASSETASQVDIPISTGMLTPGFLDTDTGVRLFEPGYHDRYYQAKFHVPTGSIDALRKKVVRSYVEGISWVLLYYYQGCPSWTWYYPYHYAPFASDFTGISDLSVTFDLGEPFLPYEQLMSVLPAASSHNLPDVFRSLMSDPESEIYDFYPEEFPIDMNGEKMAWKALVLLPFIDETRLLAAVRQKYPLLSEAERARNVRRDEVLLISNKNTHYERFLARLYTDPAPQPVNFRHFKSGLAGTALSDAEGFRPNTKMLCPLAAGSLPDISTNLFLKTAYRMPQLPAPSKSILLNGFIPPEAQLSPADRDAIMYKYPQRWNPHTMKHNLVPVGPAAVTQYQPRIGGYRAFLFHQQLMQDRPYPPAHMHSHSSGGPPLAQGPRVTQSRYQPRRFH